MEKYYIGTDVEKRTGLLSGLRWLNNGNEEGNEKAIIFPHNENLKIFLQTLFNNNKKESIEKLFKKTWSKKALILNGNVICKVLTNKTMDSERFKKVLLMWEDPKIMKEFFNKDIDKIMIIPWTPEQEEYVKANGGKRIVI